MKYIVAYIKTFFKNLFFIFRLHILFSPGKKLLLKLYYTIQQSAWISRHKGKAVSNDFFSSSYQAEKMFRLFELVHHHEIGDGPLHYLEFGVFKGNSIRWWTEHNSHRDSAFWGFDTFEGLPEDFGMIKKGGYSAEGLLPDISDPRCRFIKGLYQETLFGFLNSYPINAGIKKVIHIDCDLYSSTLFVLTSLGPYLQKGDVIIFDEFVTPTQEFKAFYDFCSAYYINTELIGSMNNYHQTAVRIL